MFSDTPSITAKLISEQKEDKEKKNYEEKEKVKADSGFQDNYSVVVASGMSTFMSRYHDWDGMKNSKLTLILYLILLFKTMSAILVACNH